MSSAVTTASATPTALCSSWDVRDVLRRVASWEDTQYSAKYTMGFDCAYFLFRCSRVSATNMLLVLTGFAMIVSAGLTQFFKWSAGPACDLLSEGHAQRMAESIRRVTNSCYNEARSIFYWTNPKKSTFITGACFLCAPLLTYLGVSLICVLALNAYVLHKPLTEMYRKHGEKALEPHLRLAQQKMDAFLKNMPTIQEMIATLSSSGKTKKV